MEAHQDAFDAQSERAGADELGRMADETDRPLRQSPRAQPAKAVHIDPDEYVKTPDDRARTPHQ